MKKDEYGNQFSDHILEQYKLYVRMADNVSARRSQTNGFFISVLSALLVILSLTGEKEPLTELQDVVLLSTSLMGLLLCWVWALTIRSYRQLNSGKFRVVHEMERHLPFPSYDREWEILGHGQETETYVRLTRMERYVPILLGMPFALILVSVGYRFLLA